MLQSGSGVQHRSWSRHRRSAASAVSRRRRGFTLRHYLVPMPTGRIAAVLSAKAKDFRVGRNGERGEIALSPSGGRAKDEHSPMRSVYRRTCIVATTTHSGNPVRAAAV
ncbi:MAG: hypothetical protein ACI303_00475 [Lepagella sp.]